jgi:hypothetical protein
MVTPPFRAECTLFLIRVARCAKLKEDRTELFCHFSNHIQPRTLGIEQVHNWENGAAAATATPPEYEP